MCKPLHDPTLLKALLVTGNHHTIVLLNTSEGAVLMLNVVSLLSCFQEYDRPNSAYMLFYERSGSLEPVHQAASLPAAPAEAEAETSSVEQQQQQPGSCSLEPTSSSQTNPEQCCPLQQAASIPAMQLSELPTGSPMQAEPSAASSPQAMFVDAQQSLLELSQSSPAAAVTTEHLPVGLSSPVNQQPQASPNDTPSAVPPITTLSPLKV